MKQRMILIHLLRRPVKTALWVLLLAIACAALCLGVYLYQSAHSTVSGMEALYTTIAVRNPQVAQTEVYEADSGPVIGISENYSTLDWQRLIEVLDGNPAVRLFERRQFLSAYSERTAPLLSAYDYKAYVTEYDEHYCTAMFVITLESFTCEEQHFPAIAEMNLPEQHYYGYSMIAQVQNVLLLHPGLDRPERIKIYWSASKPIDILEEGATYILSGHYSPLDMSKDPSFMLSNPSPEDLLHYLNLSDNIPAMARQIKEDGTYVDILNREDYRTVELPTIARLTEGADAFLAREENALWSRALERFTVTHQALAVLGTNDLNSLPAFNARTAYILSGRNFSAKEAEEGARVCIVSAALAQANGLELGDSIPLRFYWGNDVYSLSYTTRNNNPVACMYNPNEGFLSETLTYEIVGLYGTQALWSSAAYAFTPNTVFVPNASIPCEGLTSDSGLYTSILLENGGRDDFLASLAGTEFENAFLILDQGYGEMEPTLKDLMRNGVMVFSLAAFVFAVVVILYILLVVDREKTDAGRMLSLGTDPRDVKGILTARSMLPALLAALSGGDMAFILRGAAVKAMLSSVAEQAARVTLYTDKTLSGEDYLLAAQRSLEAGTAALPIFLALAFALVVVGAAVVLHVGRIGKKKAILLIKGEG